MIVILLKKAELETGGSLMAWLSSFAEQEDSPLRKAVYAVLKENYLDQEENNG